MIKKEPSNKTRHLGNGKFSTRRKEIAKSAKQIQVVLHLGNMVCTLSQQCRVGG